LFNEQRGSVAAYGTGTGWTAGTGDTTLTDLSGSGDPFGATTFVPVSGSGSVVPSDLTDYPAQDFYGKPRTLPAASAAVAIPAAP
jgi:hypothetical protein